MTGSEAFDFICHVDRLRPVYAEWRMEQAHRLAAAHGTKAQDEHDAILRGIAGTLAGVTNDEAIDALAAFQNGALAFPQYGELASVVRGYAVDSRAAARQADLWDRENEPRYQCYRCSDQGIIDVISPIFLDWFRPQFFEYHESGRPWPLDWFGRAYMAFAVLKRGPSIHVALCDCGCRRRNRLHDELVLFRQGARVDSRGRRLGPPACGVVEFDSGVMPHLPARVMLKQTLAQWYVGAAA